MGGFRVQIATLPEFPQIGEESKVLIRVTDADFEEVDAFTMGMRFTLGGEQVHAVPPAAVEGSHWEGAFVFDSPGNHIVYVDLYDMNGDGEVITYTFNLSTQSPFGYIFIVSITVGASVFGILMGYIYLPRLSRQGAVGPAGRRRPAVTKSGGSAAATRHAARSRSGRGQARRGRRGGMGAGAPGGGGEGAASHCSAAATVLRLPPLSRRNANSVVSSDMANSSMPMPRWIATRTECSSASITMAPSAICTATRPAAMTLVALILRSARLLSHTAAAVAAIMTPAVAATSLCSHSTK